MLLTTTTILIALITVYFLGDTIAQIKDGQFSAARSRTYALLLGLFMCGRMIYGYFFDQFQPGSGLPRQGIFVICTLGIAVLYTLVDLAVALIKKNDDKKFVRRKLTFFLFMLVLLVFYLWMKKTL